MNILVTGGSGYIGSHTCLELLEAGFQVIVLDNLSNSSREALRRVCRLTGKEIDFHRADLRSSDEIKQVFSLSPPIDAVIHFAGLKAVGESVAEPQRYYDNNIIGTLNLTRVMADHSVKNIVFSSSATVYGNPATVPITEDFPLSCTNPYGRSKLMIEEILSDIHHADREWNVCLLRYFNPVGAHESGRIGEAPSGTPNNLMPYISQVAIGKLAAVSVFGDDYDTVDGTGVRDYIHVVDLAKGHVRALAKIREKTGIEIYNLGTGKGYSVLEMIKAFEKAADTTISYTIAPRRAGDIAQCYADPGRAKRELHWEARRDLETMCQDTWRWQSQNPEGYKS
ncbi:MAG: UDP-glucose 4-epimerase GalE [Thermodesulfobacteriota bacterium]